MNFQRVTLVITILLPTLLHGVLHKLHPLSNEFIDYINNLNSTWKAGRNFREDTPMEHIIRLMGEFDEALDEDIPLLQHDISRIRFPEEYDLREVYPNCTSLREIRDQGACGSCWAISAVETMTDRTCIISKGAINFHYSTEDLLSCCEKCGSCQGGRSGRAWKYWEKEGIVSGGVYDSDQGCSPYTIAPCEHHMNGTRKPCTHKEETPVCKKECQKNYHTEYEDDLHYGNMVYKLNGEDDIKADILKYGSVQSHFHVYEDFLHYKSGVYQHISGSRLGKHAIKFIGWGVEKSTNTPYWIAANSWNYDWGENGFFRIVRGKEGYILEHHAHAGIPSIESPTFGIDMD